MPNLKWVCCPECNASVGLERVGQVGNLYIRDKNLEKMGVKQSDEIHCTCCDTHFYSEEPTMLEAMGKDTVSDTSF